MRKKILDKQGNTALYIVLTAIIVAAIVVMGLAFSGNIKGSLSSSFNKQNSGFDYYKDNLANEEIN